MSWDNYNGIENGKMICLKLFENPQYHLPIKFQSDDYKTEVSNLLTTYINELETCGAKNDTIKAVKQFRRSVSYTLSNYLKGIHSNAFENLGKALDALKIMDSPIISTELGDVLLYRGRVNEGSEDYTEDQMYHIPLNKRSIISTQRYSFPGLPCLYAGASVYTCWVELNRPSFEEFQVATLTNIVHSAKVLDLSRIPQRLKDMANETWFDEDDYLRYWPLMALCSIKAKETDTFKPEYIFPQFLLEYILKNKSEHIGIKYASIKVASISERQFQDDWHTYVNYVFPARSDSMTGGRCEFLAERFKIGSNRSGKELQILARMLEVDHVRLRTSFSNGTISLDVPTAKGTWNIYTGDGKPYPYAGSVFGMIEEAMKRDDFNLDTETQKIEAISPGYINHLF